MPEQPAWTHAIAPPVRHIADLACGHPVSAVSLATLHQLIREHIAYVYGNGNTCKNNHKPGIIES